MFKPRSLFLAEAGRGMASVLGRALPALLALVPAPAPALAPHSGTPLRYSEIVESAERIFVGTAVTSSCFPGDGGRVIRTRVGFGNVVVHKGKAAATGRITLTFDGGRLGNSILHVPGMPEFVIGRRYLLFVHGDGDSVSPIVGFNQGVFEIRRTEAREVLIGHNGLELVGLRDDRYLFAGKANPRSASGPAIGGVVRVFVPARPDSAERERALIEGERERAEAMRGRVPSASWDPDHGGARNVRRRGRSPAAPKGEAESPRDARPIVLPPDEDTGERATVGTLVRAGGVR